jgi:hypothetical protein
MEYLTRNGLNIKEARTFAEQYSMADLRTLPYFKSLLINRRLYVAKLKKRGYNDKQIQGTIANVYWRRGWTDNAKVDPWSMLRSFRRKSIESGDYVPPKHKGNHHGEGVTSEEVKKQGVKRSTSVQQRIANLTKQIDDPKTSKVTRDWLINLRSKLQ